MTATATALAAQDVDDCGRGVPRADTVPAPHNWQSQKPLALAPEFLNSVGSQDMPAEKQLKAVLERERQRVRQERMREVRCNPHHQA